jgi:hypothetical protein
MKVAFSAPAKGEHYAIDKNTAKRLVRALCPDVPTLAFQTMHGPKMSPEILYLATFSTRYIRILSVRDEFISEDLRVQFHERVLPYICEAVTRRQEVSYFWPSVIVAVDGMLSDVTCSDGGLFPDADEVRREIKKGTRAICRYDNGVAEATRRS